MIIKNYFDLKWQDYINDKNCKTALYFLCNAFLIFALTNYNIKIPQAANSNKNRTSWLCSKGNNRLKIKR